jgi:hypothetical protein
LLRKVKANTRDEITRLTPKMSALVVEKIGGLLALAGRTLAGSTCVISGPGGSMLIVEV